VLQSRVISSPYTVALVAIALGFSALGAQPQEGAAQGASKTGKRHNKKRPPKALPASPEKKTPDATPTPQDVQNIKSKNEPEEVEIVSIPHVIVEPARQWSWVDWVPLVFNGLLVLAAVAVTIVGILTFRAIWRQTAATESQTCALVKQAAASEEAAKMARINTEAMINSERAWVVVEDIGYPALRAGAANNLTFAFKNVGRTIARLTGPLRFSFHFLPNAEALPDIPNYSHETIRDSLGGRILSSEDKSATINLPIPDPIDDDMLSSLDSGIRSLLFYVSLTYCDSFEKERETRFGYLYLPKEGWILIGNKEYNKNT